MYSRARGGGACVRACVCVRERERQTDRQTEVKYMVSNGTTFAYKQIFGDTPEQNYITLKTYFNRGMMGCV